MTMAPSTTSPARRSSDQPLGGTRSDWRYRLVRYHLPLALASGVAIALWMTLPVFRAAGHQSSPSPAAGAAQATGHQAAPQAPQAAQAAGAAHAAQAAAHGRPPQAAGHAPQVGGAAAVMDHGGSQAAAPGMEHSGTPDAGASLLQIRGLLVRFTTATGYVALVLLAATLLIGPANLLLRRRNPISSYLRRDVGAWTAIVSVVHVVVGFQVHGPPGDLGRRIMRYFLAPDGSVLTDSFGLGNWTGLAATVIVVGLLALSSDAALRRLKAGQWKQLQRLNYALFVLVVLHAVYYGALSSVASPSTLLLGLSAAAVIVGQTAGVWLWRRRHSHPLVQPA